MDKMIEDRLSLLEEKQVEELVEYVRQIGPLLSRAFHLSVELLHKASNSPMKKGGGFLYDKDDENINTIAASITEAIKAQQALYSSVCKKKAG